MKLIDIPHPSITESVIEERKKAVMSCMKTQKEFDINSDKEFISIIVPMIRMTFLRTSLVYKNDIYNSHDVNEFNTGINWSPTDNLNDWFVETSELLIAKLNENFKTPINFMGFRINKDSKLVMYYSKV